MFYSNSFREFCNEKDVVTESKYGKRNIVVLAIEIYNLNLSDFFYFSSSFKKFYYHDVIFFQGSVQFRLPGSPFAPTCGKDSATLGKLFMRRLLQDLYVIGYDFLCSVDLSRGFDQGTLIFKKGLMSGERMKPQMICVAPYRSNWTQVKYQKKRLISRNFFMKLISRNFSWTIFIFFKKL